MKNLPKHFRVAEQIRFMNVQETELQHYKRAGKVTLTGVSPEPVLELDIATLNAMEGTIYSVYRYRNLYPKAIKAVSGGLIPLKKIVSHVFDFKDCIHAIEYSNDHKDEVIKGVIKF